MDQPSNSSSRIFKVVVQFQEKDEVFYTRIKNTFGVTRNLQNIICGRYPSLETKIQRCYVIDKNEAEFSIISTDDLEVFLDGADLFENVVYVEIQGVSRVAPVVSPESPAPPKRVCILVNNPESTPNLASPVKPTDDLSKEVHENVICDCCDAQIVGFRYKCTECFNFDLCMTCEGKMRHREHIMLRIPSPGISPPHSPYRVMKWVHKKAQEAAKQSVADEDKEKPSSRRHHHHGKRHHRRCNRQSNLFDGFFRQLNDESSVSEGDADPAAASAQQGTSGANQQQQQQPQQGQQLPYDFQTMIKMVETVAGNVSKLFDPLGDYGINVPPTTATSATTNSQNTNAETSSATAMKENVSAEQPEPMDVAKENTENSNASLVKDSVITIPSVSSSMSVPEPTIVDITDDTTTLQPSIIQPTTDVTPMSPSASNNSDDAEWLVISNEGMPELSPGQNKSTQVTPHKEPIAQSTSPSTAGTSAVSQNYTELAHNLQKHIEDQLQIHQGTAAGAQKSVEIPIVYHPVPHINMSIHRMMDMGFSNEGNCLTDLMSCCNGDIRRALDSLLYKK